MKSPKIDVHGEKITVTTSFGLMRVESPIMSVRRSVRIQVVVIMKSECSYKSYKKQRDTFLQVVDRSSAEIVRETMRPWTRRLPYKPTDEKWLKSVMLH